MAQIKYVDSNGLKKVQSDYVAKIQAHKTEVEEAIKNFIKNVTVQGQEAVVAEGTATVDLTSVLEPYAKKEDLEGLVGHISLKGSCLKEDLTTKKDEATVGDIYIVTDDNNHFYLFVGEGENGDENGFIDLGAHTEIKLDEYLKTATADETYVKITTGVTQLKEQLDAAYAAKTALEEYTKTEDLETTYCKVEDGYAKTADFVALTDQEIEAALGIGV